MDVPKETTKRLELFPAEVWSCIARYLPGEQVFRFKFTGSKSLWRKLAAPYTVQAIILEHDFLQLKRWPAIMKELPTLTELVVDFTRYSQTFCEDFRLCMIPPTLKKLKLGLLSLDRFFTKEDESDLPLGEHLTALEELDLGLWVSLPKDLIWPPNLTSLTCRDWEFDTLLPESIIKIETSAARLPSGKPLHIPPRLESFKTDSFYLNDARFASQLPPSFTSLTIGRLNIGLNSQARAVHNHEILHLRNLKKFLLVGCLELPTDPTTLFAVPSSLTELAVSGLPASFWPSLPSTLQTLVLSGLDPAHATLEIVSSKYSKDNELRTIRTIPIGQLPRSLTQLVLTFQTNHQVFCDVYSHSTREQVNSQDLESFPPALTSLKLLRAQLSKDAAKLLPSCLKILDIEQLDYSVCQYLPKGLTSLFAWKTVQNNDFVKVLPPSLTTLKLIRANLYDCWHNPLTGAKSKLRALKDIYAEWTNLSLFGLPPDLHQLSLYGFFNMDTNFSLPMPEKLETLLAPNTETWTDSCIPLLSCGLLHLNLSKSAQITGKCFEALPRSLLSLYLNSSTQIHDTDIPHLPRTLQRLYLDSAIHLTNNCAKDLPRSLQVLTLLNNTNITPDALKDLPFGLKSIQAVTPFYTATWELSEGSKRVSNPLRRPHLEALLRDSTT